MYVHPDLFMNVYILIFTQNMFFTYDVEECRRHIVFLKQFLLFYIPGPCPEKLDDKFGGFCFEENGIFH